VKTKAQQIIQITYFNQKGALQKPVFETFGISFVVCVESPCMVTAQPIIIFVTSPQFSPHSSQLSDHWQTGKRNRNIPWIVPIKLSWTEESAGYIVTNATIITFVFGKGRRRP
jgi:hypothetical protein